MAAGSNRMTFGWILVAIFWLMSLLMFVVPTEDTSIGRDSDGDGVDDGCDSDPYDFWEDYDQCDDSGAVGAGGCCCISGFVSLLVVQSGKDAKKKSQMQQVIYIPQVQQPAPQVVHQHTYVQQPTPQPAPAPVQQVVKPVSTTPPSNSEGWATEARNLELARDWEGAAKAYQKAGMYQEAGRVREMYLENKEPQVKIDIAQLGDKIQDSVVMKDGQTQNDDPQV
ncbi:MAG: hypothetical protein VYA86_00895 [Candidatus Thermoplasmatota archaeon]|nr:hypothetical protein [Candidatus Thermoplasmatota archaeon]